MAGASEYVLAVDLGGTLTKIGYARADGSLAGIARHDTDLTEGGAGLVTWLGARLRDAVAARPEETCVGFSVAVPGIIDVPAGVVKAAPNVDWYDVPLTALLRGSTGLDGAVAHDVRSGGLAEWRVGGGVGVQNLLFLPLGTGIAGAMVVDGRLLDADGYAGEIGHVLVPAAAGIDCACGQQGCLETVASAAGVARTYRRLAPDAAPLSTLEIAGLARAGDPVAREAFCLAIRALTEALVIYCSLLGPEVVVVGGGLSGAADLFLDQVAVGLDAQLTFQRRPRLVTATLGADAGLIGAGLVGWDRVRG